MVLSPSNAYAQRFCDMDKPSLTVKMAKKKTRYIRSESAADLTQMHAGRNANYVVQGLGGGEMGYKLEMKYQTERKGKQACVGVKAIKVTFYGVPQIHIASNFKRGTCEYRAVLEHEQKHIRTMLKFMREYAPKLKRFSKRMVKSSQYQAGPMDESRVATALEKIKESYNQQLNNYLASIYPVLQNRQQAIDNPQEYARVQSKCKNWEKHLFGQ